MENSKLLLTVGLHCMANYRTRYGFSKLRRNSIENFVIFYYKCIKKPVPSENNCWKQRPWWSGSVTVFYSDILGSKHPPGMIIFSYTTNSTVHKHKPYLENII